MNKFIYAISVICLSGCATSNHYSLAPQASADFQAPLQRGEIRLACRLACSGVFGYNRNKMRELHNNSLWNDLALIVANIGYASDLSYYYLGRSAEGMGYYAASKTYYSLAKASDKCSGVINVCDGFKFPREIDQRLRTIDEVELQPYRQQKTVSQIEPSATKHFNIPTPIYSGCGISYKCDNSSPINKSVPPPESNGPEPKHVQASASLSSVLANYSLDASREILSSILKGSWNNDAKAIDEGLKLLNSQALQPQRRDRKSARQANKAGIESLRSNDIEEAVRQLTIAANADSGDQEIVNNLAMALHKANRLTDARQVALAALTLSPERGLAWFEMATILADEGKPEAAVSAFLLAYRFSKSPQKTVETLKSIGQDSNYTAMIKQAAQKAFDRIQE